MVCPQCREPGKDSALLRRSRETLPPLGLPLCFAPCGGVRWLYGALPKNEDFSKKLGPVETAPYIYLISAYPPLKRMGTHFFFDQSSDFFRGQN